MYGKLVSGFILKTKCDADKLELENKMSDTSGFVYVNRL